MRARLKLIIELFFTFMKIGAFTFGGGHAMIPLIQKETVEKKGWISDDDIFDVVAIAESTPGPIAVNSATFVGYKTAGFFGALFSTVGVIIPSFVVILIISGVLREFRENTVVRYAFFGIGAGVLALIFKALVNMYKQCPKGIVTYILMALSFVAVAVFDVNVILMLVLCAAVGMVSALIAERRMKK
jgi:chromate transporter